MKRFYKTAVLSQDDNGYIVKLDQHRVKTPLGNLVSVPQKSLAETIAAEWNAQGDELNMNNMPLTQLTYSYIDQVKPQRKAIITGLAPYLETELICFYSENPPELYQQQCDIWAPVAKWFTTRTGVTINAVTDIVARPQNADDVETFKTHLQTLDDYTLTALQAGAGLIDSTVLAYALVQKHMRAEDVFHAAHIEELHQAAQWGEDPAAAKKRESTLADLKHIARFVDVIQTA